MCRPYLSEREKALPVCRASAAPFHVIKLCNATAHGKQHTDECKYHLLPAVSARLAEGAVGRKENANMRPGGADNPEHCSSRLFACGANRRGRKGNYRAQNAP